jgi:tRNA A-37 threonylcarbamoyl transferase component Bud32
MSAAPENDPAEPQKPSRFGQYGVVRMLAQGGMSQFFEGRHPQLGSRVALKVMKPALAAQPMAAARFLREAKAASQIRHQNVVEVFDVGVENGIPFLVMEFLEGKDLAQLLVERGAMPLAGLVDVFLPVISAVVTAHRAGIIHRDLKPSNLMITKRAPRGAHPMVLDFGISKIIDEELESTLTKSESLLGTVQYMAPELTKGAKYASPASDQYALGVMLYECATGQRPFTGESHYDLMHAIVTAPVKAPSEIRDSLPPEFDELVLKAMSRQPANRFPSVQALGSALMSFGDKTAWALWEDEFLGTSEGGREPWSVGTGTLSDAGAAITTPTRKTKRRSSRWMMRWTLGAALAYAAVVTILLGRREPASVQPTAEAPKVVEPVVAPAPPPKVLPPVSAAPAAVASSNVAVASEPTPPAPPEPRANEARTNEARTNQRPRKVVTPKERANGAGPAAPAPGPIASASPHPASTVGTNGAPIVE